MDARLAVETVATAPEVATGVRRRPSVWLFDLDNTLHDASAAVFGELRDNMTAYIEQHLGVDRDQANLLRFRYWQRYGATLLGLIRHHGVKAAHFLHQTHELPGLEARLRGSRVDAHALQRLPGLRLVLTNAPRAYADRVLCALGLDDLFHGVISIEDMHIFGQLRPKPDRRMFRRLLAALRVPAAGCVLVEDTLEHQRAARCVGLQTVWMQRYLRRAAGSTAVPLPHRHGCPGYVDRRVLNFRKL